MATDTPQDTNVTPDAPAQEATPDFSALNARFDELSQQVQSLAQPQQPEENAWEGPISDLPYADFPTDPNYQDGDPPQYASQQADPYQDPYGQDPQQAQQALDQYIATQIQQGIQQHVTPFITQQKAAALEAKYPALKDPQKAAQAVRGAQQYAQRLGKPELGRDPDFVELVYRTQMADDRASQETPADGGTPDVHLEGAGAAPQAEEMSDAERMLIRNGIDPNNPYG